MRPLWLLAVLLAALPASAGNKETAPGGIPQVPTLTPVVGAPNLSLGAPSVSLNAPALSITPGAMHPGPGFIGYDPVLHAQILEAQRAAQPTGQQPQAHAAGFQSAEHERLHNELFGDLPAQAAQDAEAAAGPFPWTVRRLQELAQEHQDQGKPDFDGAFKKKEEPKDEGVWRDPRILAAVQSQPVAGPADAKEVSKKRLQLAAAHGVSPALARKLGKLEGLDDAAWKKLLKEASASKIKIDEKLPVPETMTLSLELEFQIAKNLRDEDIKDPILIKAWNETGELSSRDWNAISKKKMKAIRSSRPAGWDDDHSGGTSFAEMRTKPRGRKYYSNKPRHWKELVQGLDRVQAEMPHGFYSVHGHFGREGRDLGIDAGSFARFAAVYEAPLRALAGRGWTLPKGSLDGGLGRISTARDGYTAHSDPFNVSDSYPTIEIKVLDGLADKGGKAHFDTKALLKDLYFAFALVERFKDGQAIPLVELGVPSSRGEKPSPLQQQRFLDALFGDDVLGKAIALQRLAGLADAAPALDEEGLSQKREQKLKIYDRLGLGVIFELHEQAGGYDPNWRRALLADDAKLLRRLVSEISRKPNTSLATIFPADFVPVAQLAISDVAQASARASVGAHIPRSRFRLSAVGPGVWERVTERLWDAWFWVETWFDRLFGPAPSPEPQLAGHEEDQP